MAELEAEMLNDREKIDPILHQNHPTNSQYDGLRQYINRQKKSDPMMDNSIRLPTEESRDKLQFL